MLELGQEWLLYTSPFRLKEVSAAPTGGEIIPDVVSVYAKDKAGVSALYLMDDAGSEREIAPPNTVTGTGAANRLAYWSSASALAANAALTQGHVLFADANGLPLGESNLFWDATNDRLGLGIATPLSRLHLEGADNSDTSLMRLQHTGTPGVSSGATQAFYLTSLPTAADQRLGGYLAGAFTAATLRNRAAIAFYSAGSWSAGSAEGAYLKFETTPIASTTRAERFRIGPSGQLGIGGATYGTALQALLSGGASAAPAWTSLDHGTHLAGLADDDHTQYHNDARALTWIGTKSIADLGTKTHALLTSLTADDHTQYALLAGRGTGQTLIGGTASGNNLTLQSTDHATKGDILFGSSAYKEASDVLVLGSTTPDTAASRLSIAGTITNNSSNHAPLTISSTLNGNAGGVNEMWGLQVAPIFSPSGNMAETNGFRVDANSNVPNGVIVVTHRGGRFVVYSGAANGGTIGTLDGLQLVPVFGGLDPTTNRGLRVENFGNAGSTTSIGISIEGQGGATNNYVFELPADATDPTGGGGAATGRIPCLIGGVTRYIPYY